jgi:transcriptional regulator with XRE-family HTH domain
MDMRKLVGENVRRLRLASCLTQEELAERSGLSQQYISGLENGRRNPTIVTIFELSQALGVSHVEIVQHTLQPVAANVDPR